MSCVACALSKHARLVCRQIRSAAEAIFPATVAFAAVMDNNLPIRRHVAKLPGVCQNGMHGFQ